MFYRTARLEPVDGPRGLQYARTDGAGLMTQGYVMATLRDVQAGRLVVVAATHLKAKEGAPNDETRREQVGGVGGVVLNSCCLGHLKLDCCKPHCIAAMSIYSSMVL